MLCALLWLLPAVLLCAVRAVCSCAVCCSVLTWWLQSGDLRVKKVAAKALGNLGVHVELQVEEENGSSDEDDE